jgi:hypothetical protein
MLPPPSSIASPATVSGPVCEPPSAPLAAHRIARRGAFGAASLCRIGLGRQLLFLRRDAGGRRRWLRLERDGPADDGNGPDRMQLMVRGGKFIHFRSAAHRRALCCGRLLHDKTGDRNSAADGRDNDGKKGQPLDFQGLSLQRHRLGARPTGVGNQRSYRGLTFPLGNLPYRCRQIGHFEGMSLAVLRNQEPGQAFSPAADQLWSQLG